MSNLGEIRDVVEIMRILRREWDGMGKLSAAMAHHENVFEEREQQYNSTMKQHQDIFRRLMAENGTPVKFVPEQTVHFLLKGKVYSGVVRDVTTSVKAAGPVYSVHVHYGEYFENSTASLREAELNSRSLNERLARIEKALELGEDD